MNTEISHEDRDTLERLEHELWLEKTRFNRNYMDSLFADDFFEIGRSGQIHNRNDCLSMTSGTINAKLPLQNLHIRLLTPTVAQVTYNSEVTYNDAVEKGRRSSIWSKDGEKWKLRFHQGTPYEE